IGVLAPFN
ncbi:hypothetical protein S7711_11603, partial [Stachybotrys chartarum IBT 7711]